MSEQATVTQLTDLLQLPIDVILTPERAVLLNEGVRAFVEEHGTIDPVAEADALVGQYYVDGPKLAFETLTFVGEVIASAGEGSPFLKSVPAFTRWLGTLYENIRRLDRRAGELCTYKALVRSGSAETPMKADDIARGMPCGMFGSVDRDCRFAKGLRCNISASDLSGVLRSLAKKKLVSAVDNNQWLRL
jgi:hypothetical protein